MTRTEGGAGSKKQVAGSGEQEAGRQGQDWGPGLETSGVTRTQETGLRTSGPAERS